MYVLEKKPPEANELRESDLGYDCDICNKYFPKRNPPPPDITHLPPNYGFDN